MKCEHIILDRGAIGAANIAEKAVHRPTGAAGSLICIINVGASSNRTFVGTYVASDVKIKSLITGKGWQGGGQNLAQ